jgi:AmmeMemoRadiSam system protein A
LPTDDIGPLLLKLARGAIARQLGMAEEEPSKASPRLGDAAATFVTLTRHGQLRGCIGSLEAHRPLGEDVAANALAAAFHDPRFPPLGQDELADTRVEVSLLSPLEPVEFRDEADASAKLRPGIDGVVLEYGHHRGTFLPQVWEQLPEPERFLAHLKVKAGLPPGFWDAGVKLFRYTVKKWKEGEE